MLCTRRTVCIPLRLIGSFHTKYKFVQLDASADVIETCRVQVDRYNSQLPEKCQLDHALPLPKKTPAYQKHVLLISPGSGAWKCDWQSKLELSVEWPYSFISKLKNALLKIDGSGGILFNAICLQHGKPLLPKTSMDEYAAFLVIPDFRIYNVHKERIEEFAHFLTGNEICSNRPPPSKLLFNDFLRGASKTIINKESPVGIESKPIENPFEGEIYDRSLVLICGHGKRDTRCGVIAPELVSSLYKELGDVDTDIAIVSHIGGHKFAGNLIWYKNFGTDIKGITKFDALWFARVMPGAVPLLVSKVLKNEIIENFYRGGVSNKRNE
ncbi:Aim32p Ecym_3167 [Eremothecium cymbalariae DBVPG|uniref:Altered inheritance of mitochondria protein 32 n=1 Tax=Eremothecium cymbalariae (strain CBS 270.75 / DBVPG 7215 / KCTC 17166 / NRRL Y-17582) TaxID=931890 RepID=G8JRA0_ERECY|nr:Hypothetical protein Ecym_3167 [Eremothecium cymbalariae DBVPG\